ncbi:MAG: hypothetical protein K8R02_04770 [Anaerohalosphaeraceae bacterium]|nr:hypothetical protein [Anaerohalosphaeraceae bacterium]
MKAAIIFLILTCLSAFAAVPDVNTIADARIMAVKIASDFYAETLQERIKFAYHQKFIDAGRRAKFTDTARRVSAEFDEILNIQRGYKELIVNYPGDDWQSRFEQTGLWDKIQSDIANTVLFKSRMDCFFSSAGEIIKAVDSEPALAQSLQGRLVKAKALNLNGETEKSLEMLDAIKEGGETYFEAAILKLEIADTNRMDIENLYDKLKKSDCRKNFELNARLAFLHLQIGSAKILGSVFDDFPQSRFLLTDCIAEKMTIDPQSILPGEVELVIKAALLDSLLRYRDFFVEATEHQHLYSTKLFSNAIRFILYDYKRGAVTCEKALEVFDKYIESTSVPDANIYYAYTKVLKDCGQNKRAIDVLKKIAADTDNKFSCQGQYELVVEQLPNRSDVENVEAVLALAQSCPEKAESISDFAENILSDFLARLDEHSSNQKLIETCTELAEFYGGKMSLPAIEFASIIADINSAQLVESFGKIEKTYPSDNPDLLRCKGRLLIAIGDFDKAYLVWTKIVDINAPSSPLSSQWCRGRYYQLLCLSKSSLPNASQAAHAAEVLMSSYDDIMPFWREKLALLAGNDR